MRFNYDIHYTRGTENCVMKNLSWLSMNQTRRWLIRRGYSINKIEKRG